MTKTPSRRRSGRMVMAMVLGSALSAFGGQTSAQASPQTLTDLGRYCTACWRNARLPADSWSDCTQEVFVRLLERIPQSSWERTLQPEGDERREFLRAIDAVKKRVQRSKRPVDFPNELIVDHRSTGDKARAEVHEELNALAVSNLSHRQRDIIAFSLDGYSVPEIAEKLETTPERVSDEKYKAIRKLRAEALSA